MSESSPLLFDFDWESVDDSVRAPELRATWARLQIWVRRDCVTLVRDRASGHHRRSIVVPLYPLAEWIAFNWWQLRFDGREREPLARLRRRNMASAGDGFVWPDLQFRTTGEFTYLEWRALPAPETQLIEYVSRGGCYVESGVTMAVLANLVEDVLGRLAEMGIRNTPLESEWERVRGADEGEQEFCQVASRLGLDTYSEGVDLVHSIEKVLVPLPAAVHADFLDVVRPTPQSLANSARWVVNELRRLSNSAPATSPRFDLDLVADAASGPATAGHLLPWVAGYAVARELRHRLELAPHEPFPEEMPVAVERPTRKDSDGFTGVGARVNGSQVAQVVLAGSTRAESRRFGMARAMWHSVTPEEVRGARGGGAQFLLTRATSASQQAGRAFAAELLAPAAGIRDQLGADPGLASQEELEEVAAHFGTDGLVIAHQVDNQLNS
jgi:hypothetical protein